MGGFASRGKEEEMESGGSGSGHMEGGAASGGEELENEQKAKKKRYHRHTARQIQEMEALFKECPHPDDKQRMKLSQELGLKPRQVKFWFQNRRTQMKAQQDRSDNVILRAENENLKNENFRLQAAIRNVICPNCGGPAILGEISFDEQHLRLENARLKDELDRLSCLTARYANRPLHGIGGPPPSMLMPPSLDLDMGVYSRHLHEPLGDMITAPASMAEGSQFSGGLMEHEKSLALELAMSAVDELVRMCHMNEPLWTRSGAREVVDMEEHVRMFPTWATNINKQQHHGEFRCEATRDNALVIMNSITLVDAFLDAMYAELQVLSPLVPTREALFLRYCQQNIEEGTWAIVDFPMESFHDSLHQQSGFPRYRRRPSGCLIQDMPNGYSKVTWVEQAEVEDKPVHQIFEKIVKSGVGFGAQRWLSVLQRQCERLASLMARNISDLGVIPSPEARKNTMKLAQRMIRTFCLNISSCGGQSWTALSDSPEDTIRITTRKNMEPGQPNGMILSAVSTTWLPFPPNQVFDLLRDERRRSQLEVLSSGSSVNEVAHIANGSHPGNCISLLRINGASNSPQNVELILQESCTDPSGSLIVYTTVDVDAVQVAMSGEDPSYIPLLPIGFVVLPVNPASDTTSAGATNSSSSMSPSLSNKNNGDVHPTAASGCLLTVGLQVLANSVASGKLNLSSVTAINNHICNTVHQITAALSGGVGAAPAAAAAAAPPEQ
ncbi:hypothetical protein ACLOJK_033708 [Asimina triloba]